MDTRVIGEEEVDVMIRSIMLPRLCVASVTFFLRFASDRISRRARACASSTFPYDILKSPRMMIPDFVPTHSTR